MVLRLTTYLLRRGLELANCSDKKVAFVTHWCCKTDSLPLKVIETATSFSRKVENAFSPGKLHSDHRACPPQLTDLHLLQHEVSDVAAVLLLALAQQRRGRVVDFDDLLLAVLPDDGLQRADA